MNTKPTRLPEFKQRQDDLLLEMMQYIITSLREEDIEDYSLDINTY